MAKVGADAAIRDYIGKPRLEYRTLQGVNGPLVILKVRRLQVAHRCLLLCLPIDVPPIALATKRPP